MPPRVRNRSQSLALASGVCVDDRWLLSLPQRVEDGRVAAGLRLFPLVGDLAYLVGEVRPVEAEDEDLRVAHAQEIHYVSPHPRVGGGRKGDGLDVAEVLYHPPQVEVLGAEGVSPFGDAVGLVDYYARRPDPL